MSRYIEHGTLAEAKIYRAGKTAKTLYVQPEATVHLRTNAERGTIDLITDISSKGGGRTEILMEVPREEFTAVLKAMLSACEGHVESTGSVTLPVYRKDFQTLFSAALAGAEAKRKESRAVRLRIARQNFPKWFETMLAACDTGTEITVNAKLSRHGSNIEVHPDEIEAV